MTPQATLIDELLTPTTDPPADLDEAGREMWTWMQSQTDQEGLAGARPLVVEMCRIMDRLAQIRAAVKVQGLTVSGGRGGARKNPLLAEEARLVKNLVMAWRTLGLADHDEPAKRPVGRPPGRRDSSLFPP